LASAFAGFDHDANAVKKANAMKAEKADRLVGMTVVKRHANIGIVDGKIISVDKEDGMYTVRLNTEKKEEIELTKAEILALLPKHQRIVKSIKNLDDPKEFQKAKAAAEETGGTSWPLVVAFCEKGKGGCMYFRKAFDDTTEKLKIMNISFASVEISDETRGWYDKELGFMGKLEVQSDLAIYILSY
jgi:hypothetical protein